LHPDCVIGAGGEAATDVPQRGRHNIDGVGVAEINKMAGLERPPLGNHGTLYGLFPLSRPARLLDSCLTIDRIPIAEEIKYFFTPTHAVGKSQIY